MAATDGVQSTRSVQVTTDYSLSIPSDTFTLISIFFQMTYYTYIYITTTTLYCYITLPCPTIHGINYYHCLKLGVNIYHQCGFQ